MRYNEIVQIARAAPDSKRNVKTFALMVSSRRRWPLLAFVAAALVHDAAAYAPLLQRPSRTHQCTRNSQSAARVMTPVMMTRMMSLTLKRWQSLRRCSP